MSLHRHHWRVEAANSAEIYEGVFEQGDRPLRIETEVLYKCWKCPKIKVKTIKGRWTLEQLR